MPKKIYPTPGKVFHIATLNRITSCKDSDFFLRHCQGLRMIKYCILNKLYVNFRTFLIDIAWNVI